MNSFCVSFFAFSFFYVVFFLSFFALFILSVSVSFFLRGVDTGSGQLRLCRGSSQSACCMVFETSFLRLMFIPHERTCLGSNGLINTLKIMVGHRCTCADDTRTTTTTTTAREFLYIPTESHELSAPPLA